MVSLFPFYANAQSVNEHTVATGETLQTIATKYGIAISDLKSANSGLDDYVFAGMVLKIPTQQGGTNEAIIIPVNDLKDIIYLKDGSELVAKILSIEPTEVKFEQYDTDDPFTIQKNEIASIKFENGRISDFTVQSKKKAAATKRTSTSKKTAR